MFLGMAEQVSGLLIDCRPVSDYCFEKALNVGGSQAHRPTSGFHCSDLRATIF